MPQNETLADDLQQAVAAVELSLECSWGLVAEVGIAQQVYQQGDSDPENDAEEFGVRGFDSLLRTVEAANAARLLFDPLQRELSGVSMEEWHFGDRHYRSAHEAAICESTELFYCIMHLIDPFRGHIIADLNEQVIANGWMAACQQINLDAHPDFRRLTNSVLNESDNAARGRCEKEHHDDLGESGKAKKYLIGWPEILDTLGRPDDGKDQIAYLNRAHNGPIIVAKGAKPKAVLGELVTWWNGLEEQWEASVEREKNDALAKKLETHAHGREATVAPEIGGGVRKIRPSAKKG